MRASRSIFLRAAILTAIVAVAAYGRAQASALVVPDNYASIQAAIDAASLGDTIIVRSGTYFENLTLNKPVILTAESYDPGDPTHNPTVIDGSPTSPLATITVSAGTSAVSTIRGFVIRNGNDGISVRSDVVIEYNYFIAAGDQIDYGSDSGGMIRNNVFFASGDDGIDLDNMNRSLTIENNRIMYSGDDGIEIRLQDSSAPTQPVTIT
ncbi:MAG TPA: right-handed parallel beta-helix repeat-containing protein, partial [Anaerolineales bacterium]